MSTLRYAITDRAQYGKIEAIRRQALVAQAARLAADGIDFIQLREKDLGVQGLIGIVREMINAVRAHGVVTRLLVNARADVALAAGADGVHIPSGEDQLTPGHVRELFDRAGAANPTVSVSCHTLADIGRACENSADLILFGPVFGKSLDGRAVVPGVGLEVLAEKTPPHASQLGLVESRLSGYFDDRSVISCLGREQTPEVFVMSAT
jgi:thiamine-phosphate pyrophosphorylase